MITLNISAKDLAAVVRECSKNPELHEKLIIAIMEKVDESNAFKNPLHIGPDYIPHKWQFDGSGASFKQCIDSNQRITAVKIIRHNTGLSLKDAKDIVWAILGIN